MKKFAALCAGLVLISLTLQGQITIDTAVVIRFEDALGFRDSVSIRWSVHAKQYYHELDMGEDTIYNYKQFKSPLEVRIRPLSVQFGRVIDYYYTKNILIPVGGCLGPSENVIELHVYAENYPLKVSWDSTAFNWYCVRRSIFQPTMMGPLIDLWEDIVFMKDNASTTVTKEMAYDEGGFYFRGEVFNLADTIWTRHFRRMHINLARDIGVSIENPAAPEGAIVIYGRAPYYADISGVPDSKAPAQLALWDIQGRLVWQQQLSNQVGPVALPAVKPGVYICTWQDRQGKRLVKKWLAAP